MLIQAYGRKQEKLFRGSVILSALSVINSYGKTILKHVRLRKNKLK